MKSLPLILIKKNLKFLQILFAIFVIQTPSRAFEQVDIQDIQGTIYTHRGEQWTNIPLSRRYLLSGEWINSKQNSRVNLMLIPRGTGYVQGENTVVQFDSNEKCKLNLVKGQVLYIHDTKSPGKHCKTLTKVAEIVPSGTALYVSHDLQKGTKIGVLTNNSVTVISSLTGERKILRVGEEVNISIDGQISNIIKLNLEKFYQNKNLTLGLGPGTNDDNYLNKQPTDIQKVFREVRKETLKALPFPGGGFGPDTPGEGPPRY